MTSTFTAFFNKSDESIGHLSDSAPPSTSAQVQSAFLDDLQRNSSSGQQPSTGQTQVTLFPQRMSGDSAEHLSLLTSPFPTTMMPGCQQHNDGANPSAMMAPVMLKDAAPTSSAEQQMQQQRVFPVPATATPPQQQPVIMMLQTPQGLVPVQCHAIPHPEQQHVYQQQQNIPTTPNSLSPRPNTALTAQSNAHDPNNNQQTQPLQRQLVSPPLMTMMMPTNGSAGTTPVAVPVMMANQQPLLPPTPASGSQLFAPAPATPHTPPMVVMQQPLPQQVFDQSAVANDAAPATTIYVQEPGRALPPPPDHHIGDVPVNEFDPGRARKYIMNGLDKRLSPDYLLRILEPYGVTRVNIVADAITGLSRGFAYVDFASPEGALAAVRDLNNTRILDRYVKLHVSDRERRRM